MKYIAFLFLLMIPSVTMAQQACTEMGCVNGLSVQLGPEIIQTPGHYTLAIAAGDNKITCKGVLPLKECDKGASFKCDSAAVRISESGCALPPDQQSVPDLLIGGHPRRVIIGVNRDGKSILIRTLKPVYRFVRPNGPACEPQCIVSTMSLMDGAAVR